MIRFVSSPVAVFTGLALVFGLLFALITAPFQAPDEHEHYFRAFQISEAMFIAQRSGDSVGGLLPKSLAEATKVSEGIAGKTDKRQDLERLRMFAGFRYDAGQRMFIEFPNTALNFPTLYFPQAMGIAMGRALGLSSLTFAYLARLCNLLAWLGIVMLAIKIIPVFKWVTVLLALTPMSLFLASSLSADAMTNAVSILFVATVARVALDNEYRLSRGTVLFLLVLSVLVTLSKSVYITIVLLIFLIPVNKFGGRFAQLGFVMVCLSANIGVTWLWARTVQGLFVAMSPSENPMPAEQISFLLSNPDEFLLAIGNTISTYYVALARQLIGVLGWLDIRLNPWVYALSYCLLLGFSLLDSRSDVVIGRRSKLIIFAALFAGVLLIFTALYVKWNSVGNDIVTGMQGRYFIPLSILWWFLFYNVGPAAKKVAPRALGVIACLFCFLVLSYCSYKLLTRYYIV